MNNSLKYGGLEIASGPTYWVMPGKRGLGDPKAVVDTVTTALTQGSIVTGRFTNNRTVSLQVLVVSDTRLGLSLACDALAAQVDKATNTLVWLPDGGLATTFDTFRGQVVTSWSTPMERGFARVMGFSFAALPFGRSGGAVTVSMTQSSVELDDYSAALPTYSTPVTAQGAENEISVFPYTGAVQSFTVPDGATGVDAELWGSQGAFSFSSRTDRTQAGKGGYLRTVLDATVADVWKLYIGHITGGSNGGTNANLSDFQSGVGGAGSDIRVGGTTFADRVAVAGGGGGHGDAVAGVGVLSGGDGGGLVGGNSGVAAGGTQTAGGTTDGDGGATAGALGVGGNGGGNSTANTAGGGGGGGYYGGGGGGANLSFAESGAGGSSYSSGTIITNTRGARTGAGQISLRKSGGNAADANRATVPNVDQLTTENLADAYAAVDAPVTGTAYSAVTSPAPVDGTGSMRVDAHVYAYGTLTYTSGVNEYADIAVGLPLARVGPVTLDTALDISGAATLQAQVYVGTTPAAPDLSAGDSGTVTTGPDTAGAWLTLEDSSGATQQFHLTGTSPSVGWMAISASLSGATIDLTSISSYTLDLYGRRTYFRYGTAPDTATYYLGSLRAYPSGATSASTTHAAVYTSVGIAGSAPTPVGLTIDRGGDPATLSGVLVYAAPPDTPATTGPLAAISTAATGAFPAPATHAGTYRLILGAGTTATIPNGHTVTLKQLIGTTVVATKTLTTATLSGAADNWADCGDITLPLADVPADVSSLSYQITGASGADEAMLLDTRGKLVWLPSFDPADTVWLDAPDPAYGTGGMWAGATRDTALSIAGVDGAQISGGAVVFNPGENHLLIYVPDGAPSTVTAKFETRWLGERADAS